MENKPQKVKKLTLNNDGLVRKIIVFVVVLVIAIASITYGVFLVVKGKNSSSWNTLTLQSNTVAADDIELVYYDDGNLRTVNEAFSKYYEEAFIEFDSYKENENKKNAYYINHHLNQDINISDALYNAFYTLNQNNLEYVYLLGPIINIYDDIIYTNEEINITQFTEFFNNYLAYVKKKEICLYLKNNNTINLYVSNDALAFVKDHSIINFNIFRNAFIMDYISTNLIENGHTYGYLKSDDGYFYSLDALKRFNSTNSIVDNLTLTNTCYAAKIARQGRYSLINLKLYPSYSKDINYYKENSLTNLEYYYNYYISLDNGKSKKDGIEELVTYSEKSVALTLVEAYSIFMNNKISYSNINETILNAIGYNFIYINSGTIYYTEKNLIIDDFYSGSIKYKGECLNA